MTAFQNVRIRTPWATTAVSDPEGPDTLYVEGLVAPDTIHSIPDKALRAFAEHGELKSTMAADGGDCEAVLARFADNGIDVQALATTLQHDGVQALVTSWTDLLASIASKSAAAPAAATTNVV